MKTRTKFVFLMHPKEFKREKAATGRLTHLCLANSQIHMGIGFDDDSAVQQLIRDPQNYPVLVYPGPAARNISAGGLAHDEIGERTLLVLLLDATWNCARKMLRLSPSLQALPRIMFNGGRASRFLIKQQPQVGCLSTLETTHEVLLALEHAGFDRYPDRDQLLDLFSRMQEVQMRCASDPNRGGYRHRPYKAPQDRTITVGRRGARRNRYLGSS